MLKKGLVVLGLTLSLATVAFAKTIDNVDYAEQLTMGKDSLVLNGAGLRKILFVKVYAAGLYLPKSASDAQGVQDQVGSKRVRLVLRRNVDAADFVEALNDGLKDNSTEAQRTAIKKDIESLVAVMEKIGDVHENDSVDFDYSGSRGVSVFVNGRLIGERIGGKALYDAVLRIWLGEKAIDSGLKKALLAQ